MVRPPPIIRVTLLLSLLAAPPAGAGEPLPSAATLAGNCIVCHSPAADRQSKVPPLSDLGADGIAAAMQAFKSDRRRGSIMNRIAKGYGDEEIARIAAYLAHPGERRK